ncbi:hypothetical protein ABPG74_008790 [Tetrahymena malaccensis]
MASSNVLYNLSDNFKMCQSVYEASQSQIQYPYYNFKPFSLFVLYNRIDLHESQGLILKFDLQIKFFDQLQQDIIIALYPYFYIDGILISTFSLNYKFKYQQVILWLGNQSDDFKKPTLRQFQIGSLKLYLGGFIQQCDDCSLKISDQECLQCANSSEYLEQGKNYSCKANCSFPFQNLPKTKTCSFTPDQGLCNINEGADRFFSGQCSCPRGQYKNSQQICINCLQYCTTCEDASSCNGFGYNDEFDLEVSQQLYVIPPQFYDILLGGTFIEQIDPIIYYSRLEVYTGGFYYVDYDNQDPCFVYINRQNMKCILPKQGYALNRDGVVVSATDCNQNIQQNQLLYYYNKYTMMCENSGIALPNCKNLNISDLTCIQCTDSQMILSKNCSCPDGMYLDQSSLTCQRCSAVCKTCSDLNNCLECKRQNQTPPLCNCVQHNYYIDTNLDCQKCSLQCNSCTQNQFYCLTCSQGRINPPTCYCNPDLYQNSISDSITNPCLPKNCPFKCLACDLNSQCIKCRGDRITPPYCVCSQNYYDDSANQKELCQKCDEGQYFDEKLQKCLSFQVQIQRYYIEASFQIQCSNNQYLISIYFDQEINQLENIINQKHIDNLFELHISHVNTQYFYFFNFTVSKDNQKLTLYLELKQNIQQTTAFFIFKQTQIFKNSIYVLNPVYSQKPYSFNIGPYFLEITKTILLETTQTILLENIPTNEQIDSMISQFQIAFYILNSIQPTSMFILLNIQIPPNFYLFLQQYAKRVFRNVPETQSHIIQNQYNLFWFNLNDEVSPANFIDSASNVKVEDTQNTFRYFDQKNQYRK